METIKITMTQEELEDHNKAIEGLMKSNELESNAIRGGKGDLIYFKSYGNRAATYFTENK